jgi:hypothetical protein
MLRYESLLSRRGYLLQSRLWRRHAEERGHRIKHTNNRESGHFLSSNSLSQDKDVGHIHFWLRTSYGSNIRSRCVSVMTIVVTVDSEGNRHTRYQQRWEDCGREDCPRSSNYNPNSRNTANSGAGSFLGTSSKEGERRHS